jgi:hypothetical protein
VVLVRRFNIISALFVLLTVCLFNAVAEPGNELPLTTDSLEILEANADVCSIQLDRAKHKLSKIQVEVPRTAAQRADQHKRLRSARQEVAFRRYKFAKAKAEYCDVVARSIGRPDTEKTAARRSAWRHRQAAARFKRDAYALSTPDAPTVEK